MHRIFRTRSISSTFVALCGLALTLPFSFGGCAEVANSVGLTGTVGGVDVGNALTAGGKFIDTASISVEQEDTMGQSVALAVTAKYPLKDDVALTKYVTLVGLTLAAHSENPDGNWVFGIVQSDEVNAFAGPNGYIMITTGALKHMENEAELAGVLAHEMSHCTLHHGLEAVHAAGYASAVSSGLQAVGDDVATLAPAIDVGVDTILVKGYNRDQEMASDKSATKLLLAAGYDPNAYANFLQRIRSGQTSGQTNLMSTHPGLDARIRAVRAGIPSNSTGVQLKARFDKNVIQ